MGNNMGMMQQNQMQMQMGGMQGMQNGMQNGMGGLSSNRFNFWSLIWMEVNSLISIINLSRNSQFIRVLKNKNRFKLVSIFID